MSIVSSFSRRFFLATAITVSIAASALAPASAADDSAIRLLSIDGDTGALTVLDGRTGEITGEFDAAGTGPAFAVGSDSGERFLVNYYQAGQSVIVNSGLELEPHGDHSHLLENDPAIEATLPLIQPAHYWAHDGVLAIADDGAGTVTIIHESDIGTDTAPTVIELTTGPDHTSIAIVGDTLFTANYEGGEVQTYSLDGELLIENVTTCSGAHGETVTADRAVFACDEGIVLITESGEAEWIAYPVAAGDDATPSAEPAIRSNILSASSETTVIAGDSAAGVLLFDLETGEATIAETAAPVLYVQYSTYGEIVTAIDAEGSVHGIDPGTGEVVWSTEATTPFSSFSAEEANSFFPFVSNAAEFVFVADPGDGSIIAIDAVTGEIVNRFEVGGRPARIATVSLSAHDH